MENKKIEHLKKIIFGVAKRKFYKKFVWNKKVGATSVTDFIKSIIPYNGTLIYKTAKSMIDSLYVKYNRMKKVDELKRLQNKYPDLKIFETYFYLSLEKKFANKKEDFEIFERAIQILLSKKIRFDYEEEEKSDKQYKLC